MVQSVLNSKPINQPSCTILHHSGSSIFAFWCYLLGHNALPEGCRYTNRGSLPRGTQQRSFGRSSERAGRSHCYLDAEVKSPRNQGRIQPLPSTKTQQEKTHIDTLQSILFFSSEVAFEKAESGGKTPDVVGKVRQVDGTQAEIKRFEVIAYSLGLSRRIFCRLRLSEQWEKLNISFDDEWKLLKP